MTRTDWAIAVILLYWGLFLLGVDLRKIARELKRMNDREEKK
jgi:hypothetical protein